MVTQLRLSARLHSSMPSTTRAARERLPVCVALLLTAVVAFVGARQSVLLFAVPMVLAGLGLGILWRLGGRRGVGQAAQRESRFPVRYRWIPLVWVILAFVSVQKYTQRSLNGDSVLTSGSVSVENVVELGVYTFVGLLLLWTWLPRQSWNPNIRFLALVAWPAYTACSALWALQPAYTLVKGLQLFVPLGLALLTARVLDAEGDDGSMLLRPFARIFINVSTLLALFAFAYPPPQPEPVNSFLLSTAAPAAPESPRLAWYGVHTLVAAEILGAAALLLAVIGPRFVRLSFLGWAVRLSVLCAATARTQGRSVIVGLILAVLVALWVRSRGRPLQRYLSTTWFVALGVGAVVMFSQGIIDAAARGEGTERLWNLDGRIPLWQLALHEIRTIKEIFLGLGLGASRTKLGSQVDFAGQAHNSFIEALLSGGVVGVLLLLLFLGAVLRSLTGRRLHSPPPRQVRAAVISVLVLLLVIGMASPELAGPGYSFSMICLVAALGLRSRPTDLKSHRQQTSPSASSGRLDRPPRPDGVEPPVPDLARLSPLRHAQAAGSSLSAEGSGLPSA